MISEITVEAGDQTRLFKEGMMSPRGKLRELKRRDQRLTALAENQSTCWAFMAKR